MQRGCELINMVSKFRSWNVSSLELRPTWVPFTSTVMDHQSLVFALEVYDSECANQVEYSFH